MNNICLFLREVFKLKRFWKKYNTHSLLIIANSHCIEETRTRGECMKTMPCAAKRVHGLKEAWQKQKSKLTFVFFLRL